MNPDGRNYFLHVGGALASGPVSFEEAKKNAIPYITEKAALKIESLVAPAPSEIFYYDYEVSDWIRAA